MKKRNLIIISYDYPPSTGGVARLCHEITIGLQPYYKKITVITVDVIGITIPYNKVTEVEIIRMPTKRVQCELKTLQFLKSIKNKENYNVICGMWHPEGFIAHMAGMKNIFILGHGAELLAGNSKFKKLFWLPMYANYVLNNAKTIITNSHYTKGLVKNITTKTPIKALPLGVNHTFFSPLKTPKNSNSIIKFCTVARILQFKGHDFILKVLESLPKHLQDKLEWHIAGTGPYTENLKALIAKSSIKKQITMHGFVPDEQLPDFYRNNDVFILATKEQKNTNQVEGFGLVFLEAQSCGLPVIGTKTGGITDAIEHGNGGWLLPQNDLDSFKETIISIINTPNLIKQQSIKARTRVITKSTWKMYCNNLYKIINV